MSLLKTARVNPDLYADMVSALKPSRFGRHLTPAVLGAAGGGGYGYATGDDESKWRRALLGAGIGGGLGIGAGFARPYRERALASHISQGGENVAMLAQRVHHPLSGEKSLLRHYYGTESPEAAEEAAKSLSLHGVKYHDPKEPMFMGLYKDSTLKAAAGIFVGKSR